MDRSGRLFGQRFGGLLFLAFGLWIAGNLDADRGRASETVRRRGLSNWPVVHAFNQIGRESRLFGSAVDHAARYFLASMRLRLGFNNATMALVFVGLVAMVLYGSIDPQAAVGSIKGGLVF